MRTRMGSVRTKLSARRLKPIRVDLIETRPREVEFRASQDCNDFFVYLDITGAGRHYCTCADGGTAGYSSPYDDQTPSEGMYCSHVAAAAIRSGNAGLLLPLLLGAGV